MTDQIVIWFSLAALALFMARSPIWEARTHRTATRSLHFLIVKMPNKKAWSKEPVHAIFSKISSDHKVFIVPYLFCKCLGVTLCGHDGHIFKNNRAWIREEACCLSSPKPCVLCTSVEKRRQAHATTTFGQHLSLLCSPVITHWLSVSHYSELEHDLFVRFIETYQDKAEQ